MNNGVYLLKIGNEEITAFSTAKMAVEGYLKKTSCWKELKDLVEYHEEVVKGDLLDFILHEETLFCGKVKRKIDLGFLPVVLQAVILKEEKI